MKESKNGAGKYIEIDIVIPGVPSTREEHEARLYKNPGKAYGFFHYSGKTEDVTKELVRTRSYIEKCTDDPKGLIIKAQKVDELFTQGDERLEEMVREVKEAGMNHVVVAMLPNKRNRDASRYAETALGLLYHSPLYNEGDTFTNATVYKHGKNYVVKRS